MKIGCTMAPNQGGTDSLLWDVAEVLGQRGLRLCGAVQANGTEPAMGKCDMNLKVLPDGPKLRISQSLGAGSRGCRLDTSALEEAVGRTAANLETGADCLIVNKFGKHEAAGRGFRDVIAVALAKGIPVLIGVNPLNADAFDTFTGGECSFLAPRSTDLVNWVLNARRSVSHLSLAECSIHRQAQDRLHHKALPAPVRLVPQR